MNKATAVKMCVSLLTGLLVTIASYGVVVKPDIGSSFDPAKSYRAIGLPGDMGIVDEYLLLPCEEYRSESHKLPWRGIPLNYNFYSPCAGSKVLIYPFLVNVAAWAGLAYLTFWLKGRSSQT